MTRRRAAVWRAAAAIAAAGLLVAACTSTTHGKPPPTVSTRASSPTSSAAPTSSPPPTSSSPNPCPATYADPDPNRAKMTVRYVVADDLTHVTGTEHIVFTPDLAIRELIFRLTANQRPSVSQGSSITVTSAHADHGALPMRFTAANAAPGTQGGLLHIPFASTVHTGTTVTADITFRLTLGVNAFDRYGRTGTGPQSFAWFGSGEPLLAWQRGYGWHSEDQIDFVAESATSEAMDVDLTVTAPAADVVIMSGDPVSPTGSGATRTWHAQLATARDVNVSVGPFAVKDTVVNGTRVRVGAYSAQERDRLVPEIARAITELSKRLGPFPYPSLSVARVPSSGGGIEYPGAIMMLSGTREVAVHETAHQWFYGMVGDSQALHPFLDEAFAQYSEQLVDDDPASPSALTAPGAVDRSTESYGEDVGQYYFVTYTKGAAALEAARAAGPPAAWDVALRCYVNANAWRIASPSDLQFALRNLPRSLAVLRTAGVLP